MIVAVFANSLSGWFTSIGTLLLGVGGFLVALKGSRQRRDIKGTQDEIARQVKPRNGKTLAGTVEGTHDLAIKMAEVLVSHIADNDKKWVELGLAPEPHLPALDSLKRTIRD